MQLNRLYVDNLSQGIHIVLVQIGCYNKATQTRNLKRNICDSLASASRVARIRGLYHQVWLTFLFLKADI